MNVLSDYQLVEKIKFGSEKESNKAVHDLWERYDKQICKMYWNFVSFIKKNKFTIETSLDDYKSDTYEYFLKAVNTIDLTRLCDVWKNKKISDDDIENKMKPKWKFYICLSGYLKAYNRDTLNHFVKKTKVESPFTISNIDSDEFCEYECEKAKDSGDEAWNNYENDLRTKIIRDAMSKSYSKYSELQKKIWDSKVKEENKTQICRTLNISNVEFNKNFEAIRNILNYEIKMCSIKEKAGFNITF